MDDGQPISRKRKVDNDSGHDLLSDLPLSIIHCILELVPIRDAVKTCILSKRWRYKWASIPQLVFSDECVNREGKAIDVLKQSLKNLITNAILLHKGAIHKFGVSVSFQENFPNIDHCLLWLSRNDIRELFLKIIYRDDDSMIRVHSSLYSCKNLTHLELCRFELRAPPLTFKGFSCLRRLVLRFVDVPSSVVESLVASSSLLESFTYYCPKKPASSEFRFSGPNLKYFELYGDFEEISLCAPLLTEVSVSLSEVGRPAGKPPGGLLTAEQLRQIRPVCNFTKFLGGFTNLESFKGHCYFTKYLSIGIEAYDFSLLFHHLKIIRLFQVGFHDIREVLVVVRLIMGAPNLQELRLSTYPLITEEALEAPPISFLDFSCTPNFTFNKLRFIMMSEVRGLPCEKEVIKFLLRSSMVLETLTLFCSYKLVRVGINNFMTELLSYSRASPNAKILLFQVKT